MRLSDAIALGRTLYSPCWGGGKTSQGKGCAVEMALAAVGRTDLEWSRAYEVWDWLGTGNTDPICSVPMTFDAKVMLNRLWTMDQFIDWVRSIEPAEEAEQWKPLCQYTDEDRRLSDLEHRCGVDDREG